MSHMSGNFLIPLTVYTGELSITCLHVLSLYVCKCVIPPYLQYNLPMDRYEGQRDMLYNQTFNLDQVGFAAEGIKDAQQTVGLQS